MNSGMALSALTMFFSLSLSTVWLVLWPGLSVISVGIRCMYSQGVKGYSWVKLPDWSLRSRCSNRIDRQHCSGQNSRVCITVNRRGKVSWEQNKNRIICTILIIFNVIVWRPKFSREWASGDIKNPHHTRWKLFSFRHEMLIIYWFERSNVLEFSSTL